MTNNNNTDAIALCGLPGAGKSHVSEKLGDVYDVPVVSMGDAIRYNHPAGPGEATSESLGQFAAETRAENAETIPRWVTEITEEKREDNLFIIDGVRSVTDYQVLSDYFDHLQLIEVKAHFYTRLRRLTDRGREGESEFGPTDLAARDEREMEKLGFYGIRNGDYIGLTIPNGEDDSLAMELSDLVENDLRYPVRNGKPLGLNSKLESMQKALYDNREK